MSLPNLLTGDEDLTFSKSLFSRLHVEAMEARLLRRLVRQPMLQLKTRKRESSGNAKYFAFLNQSQKHDIMTNLLFQSLLKLCQFLSYRRHM